MVRYKLYVHGFMVKALLSRLTSFLPGTTCVLLLVVALVGCDRYGAEDSELLTVELSQINAQGEEAQELGSFRVPLQNPVSLSRAVTAEVVLGPRSQVAYRSLGGGNRDLDIVVFVLLHEPTRDAVVQHDAGRPILYTGPTTFMNWRGGQAASIDAAGTVYAFFVAGIGDTPAAPVEVSLRNGDQTWVLTLTRADNTLPAQYALQLDLADLPPLQQLNGAGGIDISLTSSGRESTPIKPRPVLGIQTRSGWVGAVAGQQQRFVLPYLEPLEQLDFFLLLLDL